MSLAEELKSQLLGLLEKGAEDLINKKYDPAFDQLQEVLKEKVKPEELEAVLVAVTDIIQPKLKELLLAGADKIDGQVG